MQRRHSYRKTYFIACGLLAVFCMAWPRAAQGQVHFGLRGGATITPDQVHFGAHLHAIIVPRLRFQPNIEIGMRRNLTLIALNPELNYLFVTRGPINPYIGGGPGINIFKPRNPSGPSHTEVRVNFLFGIEVPLRTMHNFMSELKVGVGDTPDLKLTFGLTF